MAAAPYFDGIFVSVDDVFQVHRQGGAIDGGPGSRLPHALRDIEDDASEAVLVEVDLLVIGYLAEGTFAVSAWEQHEGNRGTAGT